MKLDLTAAPEICTRGVEVGDVYLNARNDYWLVVAINGDSAFVVIYGRDGVPRNVCRYSCGYLERKARVGRVEEMPTLNVIWETE